MSVVLLVVFVVGIFVLTGPLDPSGADRKISCTLSITKIKKRCGSWVDGKKHVRLYLAEKVGHSYA